MSFKYNVILRQCGFLFAGLSATVLSFGQKQEHPNVILVVSDDQGYGDFGFTGNSQVQTPVLDNLAKESIRFSKFYVCPVCAPTRAGLMTGRYSLRTGIRDTYNGGAMMATSEVTIAEVLKKSGYTTGIFGKWHLGDNYPMRPMDQGFDESVIHLSGGMGQPGDITTWERGDSSYFDPVLWHNGIREKYEGYCTDIFAGEALKFIETNRNKPFFCYLAFNAPHTPLQVPVEYYNLYRNTDPSAGLQRSAGNFPDMSEKDKEDAQRVYAMVTNIDDNMGRLLKKLDELNLSEHTIVIFMTDNGPQQRRYNAGLRGLKSSVYQGGIRVPFWIRYPGFQNNRSDIEFPAANIDVFPTLAELCHAEIPTGRKLDGMSLVPLLSGKQPPVKNRSLFFYWTRHSPELYNNMAIQRGKYKLVANTEYNAPIHTFQLYDLDSDPGEQKNIVSEFPLVAEELRNEMDLTFSELAGSDNLSDRPRIEIGTLHENPVILNRNDADGQWGIWDQEEIFGLWRLKIHEGKYTIRFRFIQPLPQGGRMMMEFGSFILQTKNEETNTTLLEIKNVSLPEMKCDFIPFYQSGNKRIFPLWAELEIKQ
jgi:arylsulfatase A-like enzyme